MKSFKVIKTEDNSYTLWSSEFDEHCHSLSGATSETLHNYIEANYLIQKAKEQQELNILEVGFGTGLGYQQTVLQLEKHDLTISLNYFGLEINPEVIDWAIEQNYQKLSNYPSITDLKKEKNSNYACENSNTKLTILIGDAWKTLNSCKLPQFNIIYQDPFSPKKNPTLWSTDWFKLLYSMAAPNCSMTTYSCAGKVSRAMREAGWQVEKFPGFGRKKESLRAIKKSSS